MDQLDKLEKSTRKKLFYFTKYLSENFEITIVNNKERLSTSFG